MRFKRLNELCDKWADFADCYMVCDEGYICRVDMGKVNVLKTGYYRHNEKYGYQQVRQEFGTKKKHTVKVHQAVAIAFVERKPGATDVDHIDHDPTNNHYTNLRWLTHAENIQRKRKGNTRVSRCQLTG